MGTSVIARPATNFSKSLIKAAILPFAADFRNSLISMMHAAVIAGPVMMGIRIVKGEVRCLKSVMQSSVNGTGVYVAVAIKVFDAIILPAFTGNVFAYSSPCPSALSRARGMKRVKIAPVVVVTSIVEALSNSKFVIINVIMTVSRTGRAKKNAVAGFLEEIFRSFMA